MSFWMQKRKRLTHGSPPMSAARPAQGVPQRSLCPKLLTTTSRGCDAPCAPPQGDLLRDSDHRTLPPPGEQRGGSPHRDVLSRRVCPPGRGYHRGPLGQQGIRIHHQRAEQESVCQYRSMAQPFSAGRKVSICLCGWHLPQAELGRRIRKCGRIGGDCRQ